MKLGPIARICLFAVCLSTPAFADSTVKVLLWDKGGMMDHSTGMGMGMGMGAHGNMMMATMGIDVDHTSLPAGKVTFHVTNTSRNVIHEMIVAPVKDTNQTLPYIANENRVDEEATRHLGEVSELDPGTEGALTITLKPGTYILFCNIPGHYVAGMWTTIVVR